MSNVELTFIIGIGIQGKQQKETTNKSPEQ